MSVHFQKLQVKDWLVYGGQTTVEFAPFQPGKNIVVVHGKNGFGKTSLLRALEFLFHNGYDREGLLEQWHDHAREAGEGSMEIALEFVYQGKLMKLIRKVDFKPRNGITAVMPSVELINADSGELENQVQDKIELIIPKKSQQFVFFDGAEITRYAQRQHDKGIREAIEQVLGIPAVRNLKSDLGKLVDELEDEQAEIVALQGHSQDLLAEIDRLKNEAASYKGQHAGLLDKLNGVQRAAEELEKEAAQIVAIAAERDQLAAKQERRADYEEQRNRANDAIKRFLSDAPLHMLTGPLKQIVQEGLARQEGGSFRRDYHLHVKRYLDRLLENGQWDFGAPIPESAGQDIEREAQRFGELTVGMGTVKKKDIGITEISELQALLHRLRDSEDGQNLMDKRAVYDEKLEEIDKEVRGLKAKLEGHPLLEVQELFEQRKTLAETEMTLKQDVEALDKNLARVTKEIDDKNRELDEATIGTDRGRPLTETLYTARQLYKAVDAFVDRLVAQKREDIEREATNIFTRITNKPLEYAGIRVKDDYTLEVYRRDGTVVENKKLSAGEKEVLAYSFITSLNLSSPSPAPFVMDTPFGHLDSSHRDGLLQSLPSLPVQVFLLATDRDLPHQERDQVQAFIAQEFDIKRNQQESRSTIVQE